VQNAKNEQALNEAEDSSPFDKEAVDSSSQSELSRRSLLFGRA